MADHVPLSRWIHEHEGMGDRVEIGEDDLSDLLACAIMNLPRSQRFTISTGSAVNDALIAALELLTEGTEDDVSVRAFIDDEVEQMEEDMKESEHSP